MILCNYSVQVEAHAAKTVRICFIVQNPISEAVFKWILHRNCEGTEQLQ